jgi:type IX secretion system PorP/SprF family membrane protein
MKTLFTLFFISGSLMISAQSPQHLPFGQDPYFVGTHNSLLFLNPSFAGSNNGLRVQSAYRSFNPQSQLNYIAWSNSVDIYIKSIKGAVFANSLIDDVQRGTLITGFHSIGYAQHLQLSKNVRLIPSLQITYLIRSLDLSKIHFGEGPDPRYGGRISAEALPLPKKWNLDASTGLLLEAGNLYGGVSVMHLTQPDVGLLGENPLPARMNAHLSYNLHFKEKTLLNLSARYSMQGYRKYYQFTATAVTFNHLITGAGIGTSDMVGNQNYQPILLSIGYRANFFTANFIYERNISSSSQTASELSLSYNLREKSVRKTLTNLEAW